MMKSLAQAAMLMSLACCVAATATAETLRIPGSGSLEYVLGEMAKAFNHQQTLHQVVVPRATGNDGALREILEGTASIGRIGRPLKDAERRAGLVFHPLGRDPVVFAGGAGVSVRAVTRKQMIDVYSGKLNNWRDLGGQPGPIRAIGREASDVSLQAIAHEVKAFAEMKMHEDVKIVHFDPQLIELLDRFPGALGFLNRSALLAAKSKLVLLTLDSVEPSADNVASGHYPFWVEFGLVYQPGALTEAGRAFLKFVDSPEGVQVLQVHGVQLAKLSR